MDRSGSPDLEAQLDRLANALRELVVGTGLRVAAGQRRNTGNVITLFIALDDHVKLTSAVLSHELNMPEVCQTRKPLPAAMRRPCLDLIRKIGGNKTDSATKPIM